MNNIYCIRHGWSDHNEAFLKSDYDEKVFESKKYKKSRLTEKGIIQARLLNDNWDEKNNIDIILCSPMERCLDTANIIFGNNCEINVLECLREFPAGLHWCNYRSSLVELVQSYPNIKTIDVPNEYIDSYFDPKKFESRNNLKKRVNKFKNYLKSYNNINIAVISHCQFLSEFLNKDFESIKHCYPYKINF